MSSSRYTGSLSESPAYHSVERLRKAVASPSHKTLVIFAMKHDYVPPGKYRARLVGRRTDRDGKTAAIELTFEVIDRHLAGRRVAGKFWNRNLVLRANDLTKDQLVDIDVAVRRSQRGKAYVNVIDFRPAGKPTAVTFVNGICSDDCENDHAVRYEYGPAALCTDLDLPELEWELHERDAEGIQVDGLPLPLLDSFTLRELNRLIVRGPQVAPSPQDHACGDGCGGYSEDALRFAATHGVGILVTGNTAGPWQLVPLDETFARFARADSSVGLHLPARLSVFQYSEDLQSYYSAHGGSVTGYRGVTWARWCIVELNGSDGLMGVLETCRRLVTALGRLGLPEEQILVFYSGDRGVSVMFPSGIAGAVPEPNFEFALGQFCQVIVDQATLMLGKVPAPGKPDPADDPGWCEPIDWSVYKPNAMFRAPNTLHEGTGLFKVRIQHDELFARDETGIRLLAKQPRPFEPPSWQTCPKEPLNELWGYALAVAHSRPWAIEQTIGRGSWVYADTFDFMHNGAPKPTGNMRLFRAAVNLLQVGCPRHAVYQLLSPAALMSGLSPAAVDRQLKGAVRYMRKPRQVVMDAAFTPQWSQRDSQNAGDGVSS